MSQKTPVLIVEHCQSGLKLNESATTQKKKYCLSGTFTEFDVENRNQRIYEARDFLPHLTDLMERKKQLGVIYGEWDHPESFDTSLSRASHVVENVFYNKEKNRVDGEIVLLNTHWGKEAQAIVEQGYPIFVSSRAAGITEGNKVRLKKLFTYDAVGDPGFASTRMNIKSLNESFGYSEDENTNFRLYPLKAEKQIKEYSKIFDLSNESKTNELFEMNKNDFATKKQLTQYSKYLVKEITDTRKQLTSLAKAPKVDEKMAAELQGLTAYYETLQQQNEKVLKYLDYLAEKVQTVVDGHEQLEKKTEKMVKYSNYLAENVEKNIKYSNYIAENLDRSISYSEYIAENLKKTIDFGDYLAENLNASIQYSEHIAENVDKNIEYSKYIAENLDKNIQFADYLSENVDKNIAYAEYIAENLDINIAYSEHIAENTDKSIKYAEYVAECADKTMSYAGMIAEKMNKGKDAESVNEGIETPQEYLKRINEQKSLQDMHKNPEVHHQDLENSYNEKDDDPKADKTLKTKKSPTGATIPDLEKMKQTQHDIGEPKQHTFKEVQDINKKFRDGKVPDAKTKKKDGKVKESVTPKAGSLTNRIDQLIEEAKKREASKEEEPHFYKFLNRSQIKAFESLSGDEQENIKVALKESQYFSTQDVLKKMREILEAKKVSEEDKLIMAMPKELQPIWESLDTKHQQQIIAQSKFHVFESEDAMENFWRTRKMQVQNLNEGKTLVEENKIKFDDEFSEDQMKSFMERLNYYNA